MWLSNNLFSVDFSLRRAEERRTNESLKPKDERTRLFVRVARARADFYLAFATPVALTTSTVEAIERLGSQLPWLLRKKKKTTLTA